MLQHKTLIAVTTPPAPWSELGNKGCMMWESRLSAVCLGRTSHFHGEADEQQTCVELFLSGVCVAAFDPAHEKSIEFELGRLFRTNTFNLRARQQSSVDNSRVLTSRELYALKSAPAGFKTKEILANLRPRRAHGMQGPVAAASSQTPQLTSPGGAL